MSSEKRINERRWSLASEWDQETLVTWSTNSCEALVPVRVLDEATYEGLVEALKREVARQATEFDKLPSPCSQEGCVERQCQCARSVRSIARTRLEALDAALQAAGERG